MIGDFINLGIAVEDIHAAVERYERAFGWTREGEVRTDAGRLEAGDGMREGIAAPRPRDPHVCGRLQDRTRLLRDHQERETNVTRPVIGRPRGQHDRLVCSLPKPLERLPLRAAPDAER